ncbi:MAG: hypothetical protein EBX52_14585, partial [Proteobacteria bacterium]|nr:hypothetical protein [Pseudomonadota bacterium]
GIRRIDTGEFYSKRHALGGDMRFFWNTKLLMGSNFCVNRRVFERLGKFDEEFGAGAPFGSSEETDFAWKAFFGREPMVFAPELVVFHVPPFAGEDRFERAKAYRYGYGKGRLVRKWLRKGHPVVLVEFFEMLVVPLLKMLPAVLRAGTRDLAIQGAALLGRIRGFLALEKEAS